MDIIIWSLIGFISGAVPYSVLVGRLALGKDIRDFGDHNPGATNVLKASGGNKWLFLAAILGDGFKAAIPIGIAYYFVGIRDFGLIPVSLAPMLGHIYSPFLGFKGGKAVTSLFGVFCGLTTAPGPIVLGFLLGIFYGVSGPSGWAMLLTLLTFGLWWVPYYANWPFGLVWLLGSLLVLWRYRDDLTTRPFFRPWVFRLTGRLTGRIRSSHTHRD